MSETKSSRKEVEAHLWESEEDGRIDFEMLHDDFRALLWFNEDGECGWAVVSKLNLGAISGSGNLPEEFLTQLKMWLEKYR